MYWITAGMVCMYWITVGAVCMYRIMAGMRDDGFQGATP
jgi:hypothetical protein